MPKELECVKTSGFDNKCLKNCEGLYITSYFKSEMKEDSFSDFWSKVEDDYMRYKSRKDVEFPEALKGYLLKVF